MVEGQSLKEFQPRLFFNESNFFERKPDPLDPFWCDCSFNFALYLEEPKLLSGACASFDVVYNELEKERLINKFADRGLDPRVFKKGDLLIGQLQGIKNTLSQTEENSISRVKFEFFC